MKNLISILLILGLSVSVLAQKENKYIRKGNKLYNKDKYEEAEIDYLKSLEANNESFKGTFNLGDALYKQKNYEDAAKIFQNLANKDIDNISKAEALYNLGNSLLETKKYEESINAYKNALRNNPDDMETKYNLEYAKKMLLQQQQQQQNQDQNKDEKDQDKDDKQEQNKEEQDKQDKDQQEQKQDEQQQDQQQDEQEQQQQPQPKQISKKDAERMLEALKNDEKNTLEKLQKQKVQNVKGRKIEKDW
ncbi:MAG: tetratricopeptide repeat protein [Bacteroidales bacterium]|nr:tetratricopeptide repeat protein [Bacteroidales bacterium]